MVATAIKTDYWPEQATTLEGILKEIRALAPAFRGRAPLSEEKRSIPPASAQDFLNIGLARVLLPKKFGGLDLGVRAWLDISVEVGKADAAHGWCASQMMHHPHYLAQFPEAAQRAVWNDGPDVSIAATMTPTSKIEIVDGGYNISCSIPYLSGINHSTWVVVGGMLFGPEGQPDWTLFLVPPGNFSVVETWNTAGMRGTGSNTVVVENVFVPTDWTLAVGDMREGRTPGGRLNRDEAPCFNAPWITYAPLTFLGPMLGAARGALEEYRSWTAQRASLFGAQVAEFTSIQVHLSRAASTLDAAEFLMHRCADAADAVEPASAEIRARAYRDQARASEMIVEAMDTIMKISGAAGFASSSPIQRAWRDVHFSSAHVILNPEVSFAAWGRQQFGLERDPRQLMY